jgi:hypothetical protein
VGFKGSANAKLLSGLVLAWPDEWIRYQDRADQTLLGQARKAAGKITIGWEGAIWIGPRRIIDPGRLLHRAAQQVGLPLRDMDYPIFAAPTFAA